MGEGEIASGRDNDEGYKKACKERRHVFHRILLSAKIINQMRNT
jgi:hypothetical protein